MSKSIHNVTIELRVARRYSRREGDGTVRSYFGFGNAPEGVEADDNGRAGFELMTADAVARDSKGNVVAAPNTFHFSNVLVQRSLDQDGVPRVTGQRQTPVHQIIPTGDTTVEQRGMRFDPDVIKDYTRPAGTERHSERPGTETSRGRCVLWSAADDEAAAE